METLDLKEKKATQNNEFLDTFGKHTFDQKLGSTTRPEKRLQAQILAEMMAIDRERAITTMKAWATFVQLASQTRSAPFDTLKEYIPARVIDAGEL